MSTHLILLVRLLPNLRCRLCLFGRSGTFIVLSAAGVAKGELGLVVVAKHEASML